MYIDLSSFTLHKAPKSDTLNKAYTLFGDTNKNGAVELNKRFIIAALVFEKIKEDITQFEALKDALQYDIVLGLLSEMRVGGEMDFCFSDVLPLQVDAIVHTVVELHASINYFFNRPLS